MDQEFKITTKRNKLTVRYRYIIFPFFAGDFLGSLVKMNMGYVVAPPPKTPPVPLGQTLDWAGIVAKKGNILLEFDSSAQIIGTEGSDPIESVNVFSEVIDIVKTTLAPDIDKYAHFYELISNYSIETDEKPLELLGKIDFSGLNKKITEIIQEPVSTYGYHFCSSNKDIENTDWFDVNIQPTTRRWGKTFDVLTVYRSKDKSKLDTFTTKYDEYIKQIFGELNKI